MARRKKRSATSIARKMAEIRKKETPEKRALRLENMRLYNRYKRANETPSKREERLYVMRIYKRNTRKQKELEKRKKVYESIQQRQKHNDELEPPVEGPWQYFVKIEVPDEELY